MCDKILYKEEAKNFWSDVMRNTKEASRRSAQCPNESAMFTNTGDHRETEKDLQES